MAHLAILVDLGGQPNKNFLRTWGRLRKRKKSYAKPPAAGGKCFKLKGLSGVGAPGFPTPFGGRVFLVADGVIIAVHLTYKSFNLLGLLLIT